MGNECSWMSGRVSVFSIQRATVEILSARHPSSASLAGSEVPSSPAASPQGKPRTQKLLATTIQRSALLRGLRAAMSRPYWLACAFTRWHSRPQFIFASGEKALQHSTRYIYACCKISAVCNAFQPTVLRWFRGSAVPAEPSCLMMVCKPPPVTSVTP